MKKISKKTPGILPPPPKTEIDGKVNNLSSKTIPELLELRDRQMKLLSNSRFIANLTDKGAKIQAFHDKIVNELKAKQEQQTCLLFDNLKLNDIDKEDLQNLEWEGKVGSRKNTYLDSDDDSEPEDVMHILSQSTAQEKDIKILKPDQSLITPEDVVSIGDIPHVRYLVEKTENHKPKPTGQFKPFKTTKSNVHNPDKGILRKKHKNWEVTAATPPPIVHGPAKELSLEESLKLQKEYNAHLKEVEAQHVAERLLLRSGIKMGQLPEDITQFGKYREGDSDDSEVSDPEGSDKEVNDEEPERGGVIFSVMK